MNLSILIITYNNAKTIQRCLDCIDLEKYPTAIIDNASTDDTLEILQKYSQKITVISNKKNIGFAAAVNQGAKIIKKDILLLNPDTQLEKDTINNLTNFAQENPKTGMISCAVKDANTKKPYFIGTKINWLRMRSEHTTKKTIDYLPLCAVLIRQNVFEKAGYLDEKFSKTLYYEDVDFSLRAKKAGFKLELCPNAICWHWESSSTQDDNVGTGRATYQVAPTKNYFLVKNGLHFFHKHYPLWAKPYFWLNFGLRFTYHKFFSNKKEVLAGLRDFWREN